MVYFIFLSTTHDQSHEQQLNLRINALLSQLKSRPCNNRHKKGNLTLTLSLKDKKLPPPLVRNRLWLC